MNNVWHLFTPAELREAAEQAKAGNPAKATVRTLLWWFNNERRGMHVVFRIRKCLEHLGIVTEPDFESAWLDKEVLFKPVRPSAERGEEAPTEEGPPVGPLKDVAKVDTGPVTAGTFDDPTYRIGKLAAANKPPMHVRPDTSIVEAITKMLAHDFSQMPVMTSEREVKGVISWRSIGTHLALGSSCDTARECMDVLREIRSDDSLFLAFSIIAKHDYVLVRNRDNTVGGIVTAFDLSENFGQLAAPFLLLGEIENHIRGLINGRFTIEELSDACDPSDQDREVASVADLTFGEYLRLLENPKRWDNLHLRIDRGTFVKDLDKIRQIRNDVMHFDPDGIAEDDLDSLGRFAAFLQRLREVGVKARCPKESSSVNEG